MKLNKAFKTLSITLALIGISQPIHAKSLEQIKKDGVLRVAMALNIPLYSYANTQMEPDGSDVETANKIAKDLGVKLKIIQVTNAARVPTIQTDKADLVISCLAITPARQNVIDFTMPYASLETIVGAPDDITIKNYADLKNVKIGVARGTVNDTDISKNAKDANIHRFEDDATLITAAVSGQVQAISSQLAIIEEVSKNSKKPYVSKFTQQEFMLGIALPKNEPELKSWLNQWISTNLQNGKLNTIYKKYHETDLPKNILEQKA